MFNTKILTNRCIAKREMIHFKSLQFNWTEISQSLLGGPICNRTGSGGCVLPAPPTFFFETQQTLTKKKVFPTACVFGVGEKAFATSVFLKHHMGGVGYCPFSQYKESYYSV